MTTTVSSMRTNSWYSLGPLYWNGWGQCLGIEPVRGNNQYYQFILKRPDGGRSTFVKRGTDTVYPIAPPSEAPTCSIWGCGSGNTGADDWDPTAREAYERYNNYGGKKTRRRRNIKSSTKKAKGRKGRKSRKNKSKAKK